MADSAVRLPSRESSIASRRDKTRDDSAPARLALLTVLPAARGIEPLIAFIMMTQHRAPRHECNSPAHCGPCGIPAP